jgi:hypothetical protein
MLPDSPQSQPGVPASLPPVQVPAFVPAPVAPVPAPTPEASPLSGDTEAVVARAKNLVEQYHVNPYQLNGALQQLKSEYIAERFHISTYKTQQ